MKMAATSGPATGTGTLVYLVRHGRTPLNESDDLRGVLDPPLDDVGQRQAGWLGIPPAAHDRPAADYPASQHPGVPVGVPVAQLGVLAFPGGRSLTGRRFQVMT